MTVGPSGTHSVCVCTYHQNSVLLVSAIDWNLTYKDLMKIMVCNIDNRDCMVHRCENCPGAASLKLFLEDKLKEFEIHDVNFTQWQNTDRPTMGTHSTDRTTYIELLVDMLDRLTSHSYIAKSQGHSLKKLKSELPQNECIVLLDFAENYKYVVQDEIQSFHWNNQQCTLHPVVVYARDESNQLQESSLCIMPDDMNHDVPFVHEVQRLTAQHIKEIYPAIERVHYFSDGCAKQYKNYKNLLNLCHHKDDFKLAADWSFFATSHGKSACEGVGGTVKRLTARASLQRPISNQILTVDAMFAFCT